MFQAAGGMDDIMSAMFGGGMGGMGGGGMRGMPRQRKGRDVGIPLPVTLADLYNGKTTEVPRDKTIKCTACNGSGSNKPGADTTCKTCRGQGARMAVRQMGPMIQQMQVPCDDCSGRGTIIDSKDKCNKCQGGKTEEVPAPLTVTIQRGMRHSDQIPFPGEGDMSPDIDVPGAIVVVLQQVKEDAFVRQGDDLLIKRKISLGEALCGFQLVIEHLDKRKLVVRGDVGAYIQPGERKVVTGEGMPIRSGRGANSPNASRNLKFGDLIVEFDVEFPERLEQSQIEELQKILAPDDNLPPVDPNGEQVFVYKEPLETLRKELEAEDDDDEDSRGGASAGPGCATQ